MILTSGMTTTVIGYSLKFAQVSQLKFALASEVDSSAGG
jgi:hypothetical protein